MRKNQEGFIADFQKMRTSQKPSWFNLFMRKNQEGFISNFQKIRSAQNPSWFDNPP
jgi:ribosomal protein S8